MQVWCDETLVGRLRQQPKNDSVHRVMRLNNVGPSNSSPYLMDAVTLTEIDLKVHRRCMSVDMSYAKQDPELLNRMLAKAGLNGHDRQHVETTTMPHLQETRLCWRVLIATIDQCEQIFDHDDFEPMDSAPYYDLAI